jgi:hypothetical protein
MAFKEYKIIEIKPNGHTAPDYKGFVTEEMLFIDCYTFTIIVSTWWGLKQVAIIRCVECSKGYKIYDWWESKYKDKWVTELPFKK